MTENDTSAGHRQRLRDKFIKSGLAGFHDYEIVELLLSLSTPRRDLKPAAKAAIDRFGSLRGVLEAPVEELQKIKGIGSVNSVSIKVVHEVAREFLKERLPGRTLHESSGAVFDYLYHSMRDLKKEIFKVLYLNSQNQILETQDLFEGTADSSVVWAREVVAGAIKHNATALIFAHNHPSGNPEPSESDKDVTRDLVYAARIMQISVLDHIIIGDNRYYSFAGEGLIERFEIDFLTLKMKGAGSPVGRGSGALPWSSPG